MSDQPTPPKPKPGSLRDRIAAFEKQPSTLKATPGPPPPRPKPGGLQWKPKVPSPPGSPSTSELVAEKKAGMSASDAKESIGQGGSLKERMAALQGRGAFGAPPPPTAPKPALDKPKWKPPPVISPPPDDHDEPIRPTAVSSPPSHHVPTSSTEQSEDTGDAAPQDQENDPEEEERQRRAAIAARMARLGGARLGMGPSMFGQKPTPKKVETSSAEAEAVKSPPLQPETTDTEVTSPQPEPNVAASFDYFPPAGASISPDSSSNQPTSPPSQVTSPRMPVPAAPRRAAPPRKKTPKTPSPAASAPAPEDSISEVPMEEVAEEVAAKVEEAEVEGGDREPEIADVDTKANILETPSDEPTDHEAIPQLTDQEELVDEPKPISDLETRTTSILDDEAPAATEESSDEVVEVPTSPSSEEVASLVEEHEDEPTEEEEEAARRTRAAEKLAKMGGVNPFAALPKRQSSTSSAQEAEAPQSPLPARKASTSTKRSSVASERSVPPPPVLSPRILDSKPFRRSTDITSSDEQPEFTRQPSLSTQRSVPPPSAADLTASVFSVSSQPDEAEVVSEPTHLKSTDDIEHELEDVHQQQDEIAYANDEPDAVATHDYEYDEEEPEPEQPTIEESEEEQLSAEEEPALPPPPMPNFKSRPISQPPPPVLADNQDQDDDEEEESAPPLPAPTSHRRSIPPPPRLAPHYDSENEEKDQQPMMIHPRTISASSPLEDTSGSELLKRVPPLPPNPQAADASDQDGSEVYSEHEPEPAALASPPPLPVNRPPRFIPPPVALDEEEEEALPHPAKQVLPTPPRRSMPPPPPPVDSEPSTPVDEYDEEPYVSEDVDEREGTPTLSAEEKEEEVLDEDEGDPIDPSFHSPGASRRSFKSSPSPRADSPQEEVAEEPEDEHEVEAPPPTEEDTEQARRRTIAERMAKLGGIKFGAAPPIPRAIPKRQEQEEVPVPDVGEGEEAPEVLTEEEEEAARKQRITAKLASMGGMRFGMLPQVAAPPAPSSRKASIDSSFAGITSPTSPRPAPPPARAPPRPAPVPVETESEYESTATSDDGVKVEAEESELEEVSHQDATEDVEEFEEGDEPPPAVPTRAGRISNASAETLRKSSSASTARPPVPHGIRPIAPSAPVPRKTSTGSSYASPLSPTSRRASIQKPHLSQQQSDFVLVGGEAEEEPTPAPPPRKRTSMPPVRGIPPPPAPGTTFDPSDSISSQWELPNIPSSTLGFDEGGGDLSLSWSEDSTTYPSQDSSSASQPLAPASAPLPPPARPTALPENLQLSSEDLMVIWGKVGVRLCEAATTLHENSKKMLVGDGTFEGFVHTSLKQVDNALVISSPPYTYGYTIYMQTGSSVQKRVSEILPGDIITLHDAKFKGHKGLQSYQQHVGTDVPLVGIISEFEPKKSKVKVFQANQHVGQQTVESVSYRLDDMKSGMMKVFRVLEA